MWNLSSKATCSCCRPPDPHVRSFWTARGGSNHVVSTERYGPPIVPAIAICKRRRGGRIWICWRRGYSRVVGFVGEHGAAADASVVETADLDAIAAAGGLVRFRGGRLRRSGRADTGLLVRPHGLVVGGLQRPGQPLYLRAPRVVRPRQSFDSDPNQTHKQTVSHLSEKRNKEPKK